MNDHLDLDALADALATESDGGQLPAHLQTCSRCTAALDELRTALGAVAADLAGLPVVPPVPAALEPRPAPAGATTVLPAPVTSLDERRRPTGWLLAAGGIAAAAVLVIGGGLLLTNNSTDSNRGSTAANGPAELAVNATGTDYRTPGSLQAALPRLLKGRQEALDSAGTAPQTTALSRKAAADPLARLRTTEGLASCLASLTDPTDPGVPLALDYASYKGQPALVVVLPSAKPSKLDIWVVGASCDRLESNLLVYVKADRPQ